MLVAKLNRRAEPPLDGSPDRQTAPAARRALSDDVQNGLVGAKQSELVESSRLSSYTSYVNIAVVKHILTEI